LRVEAGLSQVEFGERCGFCQTYLSRLERGQANPTLNAMEVIANGLRPTMYELWGSVRRAGLSQVEFGERCGFYQTYLSRLERGQANPTLNAMGVIANGLGLNIYQLWEATKELPPR
jgi:transcriptional regulator with XRE-family HTH domain